MLLALVLMAAVWVNTPRRRRFLAAATIGLGAIVGLAVAAITGSLAMRILADALGLALLGFTALLMLNSLIYARRVSPDMIVGGICVYLLIGLCFAMMFGLICNLDPEAILEGEIAIERASTAQSSHATKFLYFSFATLATLGYGDITPRSELAQMGAVGEAVIGQLYLAIFVARLVALCVAGNRHRPRVRREVDMDED